MQIIDLYESQVRSYSRLFPAVFHQAIGPHLYDTDGNRYLDFFCGAGALNYGHNHPELKELLLDYIRNDGVTHSLDMATLAKVQFIKDFNEFILKPRNLTYKLQFCGPTGANAVEAALKLARKYTQRETIAAFTNAYHGLTLGALAVTDSPTRWQAIGFNPTNTVFLPYADQPEMVESNLKIISHTLAELRKTGRLPAAIIVETIQAEGGVNVAPIAWLQAIQKLASEYKILFIVDEIQTGCGRTKNFFSFELAQINPDIICLSKSLSGYGLPMSMLLIKEELDIWFPGEHSGTFRGNNLAFVTARHALKFWQRPDFLTTIESNSRFLSEQFDLLSRDYKTIFKIKGRGFMWGLEFIRPEHARRVATACFEQRLLVEVVGPHGQVIKLLPALICDIDILNQGLVTLKKCIDTIIR